MKRLLLWALSVALLLSLCACGRQNVENTDGVQSFQGADEQQKDDFSQPEDTGDARDNNSQKQSETSTIFTNDYGTRTTIALIKVVLTILLLPEIQIVVRNILTNALIVGNT